MPNFIGFHYRVIVDLYRILFHAVVIFGPEHDFLFKSASTYCELSKRYFVMSDFLLKTPYFTIKRFRVTLLVEIPQYVETDLDKKSFPGPKITTA